MTFRTEGCDGFDNNIQKVDESGCVSLVHQAYSPSVLAARAACGAALANGEAAGTAVPANVSDEAAGRAISANAAGEAVVCAARDAANNKAAGLGISVDWSGAEGRAIPRDGLALSAQAGAMAAHGLPDVEISYENCRKQNSGLFWSGLFAGGATTASMLPPETVFGATYAASKHPMLFAPGIATLSSVLELNHLKRVF